MVYADSESGGRRTTLIFKNCTIEDNYSSGTAQVRAVAHYWRATPASVRLLSDPPRLVLVLTILLR